MDCVVCYEKTENKTKCGHLVCEVCLQNLEKQECPYCRSEIQLWRVVKLPFYYFVKLFDEYYRRSQLYRELRVGIEYEGILNSDFYYVFEEQHRDCTWTTNYNEAIYLRIYNVTREKRFTRMEFNTVGLDENKRNRFFYNFFDEMIEYDVYLKSWVNRNLKV